MMSSTPLKLLVIVAQPLLLASHRISLAKPLKHRAPPLLGCCMCAKHPWQYSFQDSCNALCRSEGYEFQQSNREDCKEQKLSSLSEEKLGCCKCDHGENKTYKYTKQGSCETFCDGSDFKFSPTKHENDCRDPSKAEAEFTYEGCFANDQDGTFGTKIWHKTVLQCSAKAKARGKTYFGMEYPQGSPDEGDAQCLLFDDLPSLEPEDDSDCEEGMFSGYRLGGQHRVAVYVAQATFRKPSIVVSTQAAIEDEVNSEEASATLG